MLNMKEFVAAVLVLFLGGGPILAEGSGPGGTAPRSGKAGLTVAVLSFESNFGKLPESGKLISEVISARLSIVDGLTVVERKDIDKVIREQKLTMAGLVSTEQAVKVGRIIGAHLLVTGRVMAINKGVYLVCKVISAETSEIKGFFLSFPQDVSLTELLDKTTTKLATSIPVWAKQLTPKVKLPPDAAAALRKLLIGKTVPKLAVLISEVHFGRAVVDPAVETEFCRLLSQAGAAPVELDKTAIAAAKLTLIKAALLSASARARTTRPAKVPRRQRLGAGPIMHADRLRRLFPMVRYLICGEAFSEYAEELHGMTICSARAEVKVVDLRTGTIVLADSETTHAPDLSERVAGKTALKRAGQRLARRMLPKLIERFDKASPPRPGKDRPGGSE